MGKAKKKLYLFKHYRKNIEILCENPRYKSDVLQDIVICPICFHTFKESDVKASKEKNFLTIEHVPPQFLGGKTEVLTCHTCNNRFSEFDRELSHTTLREDSTIKSFPSKISLADEKFGAIASFNLEKGEVVFPLSNKTDLSKVVAALQSKNEFTVEVTDKIKAVGSNLLKMAYLLAFHKFGYGLIMQPQYNFIRAQINNPYQSVLDNHGVVYFGDGDSLSAGVFVVKEPKELISLLVRFEIKKDDGTTTMYSVHLPSPGVDVMEFYKKLGSVSKGTKYIISDFGVADYWHDRRYTYAPIYQMDHYLTRGSLDGLV